MIDTIVAPHQGARLDVLGDVVRILATAEETGGVFGAVEFTVMPGGGAPLHANNRENLAFYVADGSLQFTTNGEVTILGAGSWFFAPAGNAHTYHNKTDDIARTLMLCVPGGFEQMFADAGRTLGADETSRPPREEDIGRVMEATGHYGVDIFPPTE